MVPTPQSLKKLFRLASSKLAYPAILLPTETTTKFLPQCPPPPLPSDRLPCVTSCGVACLLLLGSVIKTNYLFNSKFLLICWSHHILKNDETGWPWNWPEGCRICCRVPTGVHVVTSLMSNSLQPC